MQMLDQQRSLAGASPSSILTSASASASTGRPFGRPLTRLPRSRDVSTITESIHQKSRARFALSFQKVAMLLDVHGEDRASACRTSRSASSVSRRSSASMMRIVIDDRTCGAVALRDRQPADRAHVMNRFSIVFPIRCDPDSRMIAWWNAMFASEYSWM
jgi:hypothetical protein